MQKPPLQDVQFIELIDVDSAWTSLTISISPSKAHTHTVSGRSAGRLAAAFEQPGFQATGRYQSIVELR